MTSTIKGDVFLAIEKPLVVVVDYLDGDDAVVGISQMQGGNMGPMYWVHFNNAIRITKLEDSSQYIRLLRS